MSLKITSEAFARGEPIPVNYTADGSDVSAPLYLAMVIVFFPAVIYLPTHWGLSRLFNKS